MRSENLGALRAFCRCGKIGFRQFGDSLRLLQASVTDDDGSSIKLLTAIVLRPGTHEEALAVLLVVFATWLHHGDAEYLVEEGKRSTKSGRSNRLHAEHSACVG